MSRFTPWKRTDEVREIPPPIPESGRLSPDGVWYLLMTIVAAAVIFAAVVSTASVSPAFCKSCHRSAGETLASSAHAGARCDSCHVSGGALGVLENRFRVVAMVAEAPFVAIARGSLGGTDGMDNEACLVCHESSMSKTLTVNGIRMNHRSPEEKGWLCTECHSGTAHAAEEPDRASYTMEDCMSCHSAGTENLATCTVCHPDDDQTVVRRNTPWRVTHGSNWQQTHGMGDLDTCKVCHGNDYCVACHGMSLPHVPGFLGNHGDIVVAGGQSGDEKCLVCHKGKACEICHGMEMPHPTGFIKEHKSLSEELGRDACERCHKPEQCVACHTRHTHPGIPAEQLKKLKANPVDAR